MSSSPSPAQHGPRLERFLRYLERDPDNIRLLGDAASAAFDDQAYDLAAQLLERHEALAPLPPATANLAGLVAIARQQYDQAIARFEELRRQDGDIPVLRFNIAWAHAMSGAYQEALDLLDDPTVAASPRAPALKVQMLHHLDLYEDALACGQGLAERYPDNEALMGALSTLALDADEIDLARHYAERAGENAEGLATLGMLGLTERPAEVSAIFDRAIELQPGNPRAWIGKGLGLLAAGESAAAAEAIDKGATLFGNHLGSWIAAGWAHFVNGDLASAQTRFEETIKLDPNFAEGHGGLAVLEIAAGRLDDAHRHSEIALRLDRNSLGGALAKSLLLESGGDAQTAQRIREIALSAPVGPNGQTIAQALAAMGFAGSN